MLQSARVKTFNNLFSHLMRILTRLTLLMATEAFRELSFGKQNIFRVFTGL